MIGARLATLGALALLTTACLGPGDFRCTEHAQCTIGGQDGFCEANGHCSVPDPTCMTSARRYVHHAGGEADACVPEACGANKITTVSAGGGHACLVRTDGSLWCWGRNDRGQLGDGTRTSRALPVRVAAIDNVVAVAAGDSHTCAATAVGIVYCWGADDAGQLGDRGGDDRGLPQRVFGVGAAALLDDPSKILAAGKDFSCAVDVMGGVLCWGDDSVGQLGDAGAAAGPPLLPTPVAGLTGVQVLAISASWQHVCALTTGGQVSCWGANDQGQIGDGTTTSPRAPTAPDPASLPPTIRVTSVVTGHGHTCALSAGGLMCWGGNAEGQVDPQAGPMAIPTPQQIAAATDPIAVAAGARHTCIVREGDSVQCWGANGSEQLGDGTPIGNTAAIVAGGAFSCALATDDALYCWGDNRFGQLAIGGNTVRATPAQVPGLAHVTALAAGGAHTCATADDVNGARAMFCWGANDSGQLGNGSSIDVAAATRISSLEPTGIAAGARHTCAFPADKQLRCWGWGASGELGQPAGFDMVVTVPTATDLSPPEGGDGVFAVATGASHTCVGATISASVLCFGLNVDGQLGNGTFSDPGGPVPSLLARSPALAAGDAHTCAIDDDGAVWCWGRGDEGQLGDGAGTEHASPTAVTLGTGGATADAITAGAAHTCALAGGRILCWGRNADGQLGAPLPAPLTTPRVVSALPQARAVVAGGRHTCAIDDHAAVSCWGANESGQLGNGTTDSSNSPVPVVGLTNVDAVVAGGAHTCARRSDGTVWCWGANTAGQLGDGVTLTSPRPLLARIACD